MAHALLRAASRLSRRLHRATGAHGDLPGLRRSIPDPRRNSDSKPPPTGKHAPGEFSPTSARRRYEYRACGTQESARHILELTCSAPASETRTETPLLPTRPRLALQFSMLWLTTVPLSRSARAKTREAVELPASDTPFHILLVGDFSGGSGEGHKTIAVDRDNLGQRSRRSCSRGGGSARKASRSIFNSTSWRISPSGSPVRAARAVSGLAQPSASACRTILHL